MQAEPAPLEKRPAGLWRGVWKWLALLPVVLALIFTCSQTAQLGLGYPVPSEVSSRLYATYAPWERVVLAPVSTEIIQDLPEWQDQTIDEITEPGVLWVEPTPLPPVAEVPIPEPTQGYQATSTSLALLPSEAETATPSPTATATLFFYWPTLTHTPTFNTTATLNDVFSGTQTPSTTPSRTATPSPTRTLTPTFIISPTPTRTPTPSHTPTETEVDASTPTNTLPPSITPTPTRTHTPTSTSFDDPTNTPTYTPTITLIPTVTRTPTITPTPTPTQPPCGGNIPPGEPDIGLPDGSFASLPCGGLLILDLPALGYNAIDLSVPDSGYDLVFYERKLPPQDRDLIELDWVNVAIGPGPSGSCATSDWYMGFNWGDGVVTNNGHLGSSFPEIDNQEIPLSALWGVYPLQTGIAIDLDSSSLDIPAGLYPCIRIISPFNYPDNDPSEVDALQLLP